MPHIVQLSTQQQLGQSGEEDRTSSLPLSACLSLPVALCSLCQSPRLSVFSVSLSLSSAETRARSVALRDSLAILLFSLVCCDTAFLSCVLCLESLLATGSLSLPVSVSVALSNGSLTSLTPHPPATFSHNPTDFRVSAQKKTDSSIQNRN